jgi:hypothetical protein
LAEKMLNRGGSMRKILLLSVLLGAVSWAVAQSNDYPINVHVRSSHWNMEPSLMDSRPVLRLQVVIEGKNVELAAPATLNANFQAGVTLLLPGDYKARLVQDVHKTAYESSQAYEFLLPDKKTRKFVVVGLSE